MITKSDFLKGVLAETQEFFIGELQTSVLIKGLSVADMERISAKETNDLDTALLTVLFGLVTPKLEEQDLEALKQAKPGVILKLAKKIGELSGLENDSDSPN